eukprot:CAMPEP_0116082292 /NCGR_PEP_ID=MMETSP0327-20121206/2656_1 /TAXON_ID=44447 /ORGANISM="Pseudo-nitzschia delicatissima, Strain B596" /LENGTH=131 /DNA_ID=CAMNT_0003573091 /DNA_START=366 /DNA_END=761 /DNA_ORIENTATION=-
MAVSTSEQIDGTNGEGSDANASTREQRPNNGTASSKTKTSLNIAPTTNDITCTSSLQRFRDNATKIVKEEPLESPSGALPGGDREEGQRPSISSCTRYSSKLAPICSSPLRTTESSRTHVFSPPAPSAKVS